MAGRTVVIETVVRVRVKPDAMQPYPTIAKCTPDQIAMQLVQNTALQDLRWLTGVDELVSAHTRIIETEKQENINGNFAVSREGMGLGETHASDASPKHAYKTGRSQRSKASNGKAKSKTQSKKVRS